MKTDESARNSIFILLTGLSGSGKTTLAKQLENELIEQDIPVVHLDGDLVRKGLSKDLGFTPEDRKENLRRVGELGSILVKSGIIVIASFIAPYSKDRNDLKEIIGVRDFFEVYLAAPLEVCESRDPKGLYKRARKGEITSFTGITAPYEIPESADLILRTDTESVKESTNRIVSFTLSKLEHK